MKRLYTLLTAILLTSFAWAQAPQKMSYQAVVRDAANALMINQEVGIQISLLQGSVSGDAVYVETQAPTTNDNGLFSIEIGAGAVISGSLTTIDWSEGPYFIHTETDPTGGTNYTVTGTSQLLSVPYALHAATAEKLTEAITETDPLFSSSVASKITAADTVKWNQSNTTAGALLDSAGIASMGYVAGPRADLTKLAPLASPTFTGTVSGIDKTMVGLSNLDNTSDADKPVSIAIQTALDLKESANNKSTDGTLATNSDNLFPTEKAVKTYVDAIAASGVADASTTAAGKIQLAGDLAGTASAPTVPGLALKAPLADPTFTGTVSGIDKTMVGLSNLDNTSDADKPVSTATQAALDLKSPIADPSFTGTPSAPTASDATTNTTQIATTAFVQSVSGGKVADAINDGTNTVAPSQNAVFDGLALKAPIASPTLTGTPAAPTASDVTTNTTQIATTAFVQSVSGGLVADAINDGTTTVAPSQNAVFDGLALKAPLASPTLTGTPAAPTASDATTNTTQIATTAFVQSVSGGKVADAINDGTTAVAPSQNAVFDGLALKAPLANPAFTGTPAAPTAASGTNTTQIATTAFVQSAVGGTYSVNTFYAELGGYVIEVNSDGTHGIVVAMQNQGRDDWNDAFDLLSNAANHDTDGAKFKDWRLPTKRELNLIYEVFLNGNGAKLAAHNGFWSGTTYGGSYAWYQNFGTGAQAYRTYSGTHYARAVRTF